MCNTRNSWWLASLWWLIPLRVNADRIVRGACVDHGGRLDRFLLAPSVPAVQNSRLATLGRVWRFSGEHLGVTMVFVFFVWALACADPMMTHHPYHVRNRPTV